MLPMTDTYLRSLSYATAYQESRNSRDTFSQTWRYQFDHAASDGIKLFIERPLSIDSCRLSAFTGLLTAQDVFATIDLHDRAGLEASI